MSNEQESNNNDTAIYFKRNCGSTVTCERGLILPEWLPSPTSAGTPMLFFRTVTYFLALAYLFLGLSIITDRMISATEVIMAQKRAKTVKLNSGNSKVSIWHPIVASLTVCTIGSSPEILFPIIEMFRSNFEGRELGPALIIGSGAYHFFFTTGICMLSGKETFAKPIKDRYVFFAQTVSSILAYLWIYLVLLQISPGVVQLWEAILTLAFFPLFVLTMWTFSKRFPHKLAAHLLAYYYKRTATTQEQTERIRLISESLFEEQNSDLESVTLQTAKNISTEASEEVEKRRVLSKILVQLKLTHPEKSRFELEEMAEMQMFQDTPKNVTFYRNCYFATALVACNEGTNWESRMQAVRRISGAGDIISKAKIREKLLAQSDYTLSQKSGFMTTYQTCEENCGSVGVTVSRWGVGISDTKFKVDYATVEGKAKENHHYIPTSGTVSFLHGEQFANVSVQIIDDDIYEARTKTFQVKLSNPRIVKPDGTKKTGELVTSEVTISILDDDHCGLFTFEALEKAIADDIGTAKIKVVRSFGSKGHIALPYRINPGTAKPDEDYVSPARGILHFEDGQTEGFIDVQIIDKNRVGEVFTFFIELLPPLMEMQSVMKSTIVQPGLGDHRIVQIGICENEEMNEAIGRLLKMTDLADYVVSVTWADQLNEAFKPELEQKPTKPTFCLLDIRKEQIFHCISFPWKLLVALLPPARLLNGWMAYLSLFALMVIVTIMISDCAYSLGCTIGLTAAVTGITIITVGMGLPDTIASRYAAIHEKTADAAIGHVTGANTVSIFLGIGLAWTIGAIYYSGAGGELKIYPANLSFFIMIYCGFASAAVLALLMRRLPPIRGELGGTNRVKIVSATFFILLYVMFIVLSICESVCVIG